MKFKTKALILFCILIVITIIRETGILNVNLYRSNLTDNLDINHNYNEVKIQSKKSGFNSETKFKNENYADKEIVVTDNPEKIPLNNNSFDIIIKKATIPISFTPFYTNVDFEIEATIDDNVSITKTDSINMYLLKNNVKGTYKSKGNLKAYGLISNYEIKRLITASYTKAVENEFKKYLLSIK